MKCDRSGAQRAASRARTLLIVRSSAIVLASSAVPAAAQQARITNVNNAAFGTLTVAADQYSADDLCVYSSSSTKNYTVVATGSGAGGAFTLAAGSATLAYEVEWSASSGQTSGTPLTSGTTSGIYTSTATASGCTSGPTVSASRVLRLRLAQVSKAQAGAYTGTLNLTITPQ